MYQLFRGLKYMHTSNIFHRDLKPDNLLVNPNCDLAICDFGMGRVQSLKMTVIGIVTTRWYLAPEGLFHKNDYTAAIDIWSAGCILAELLLRRPLFPSRSVPDQLAHFTNILGTPSTAELTALNDPELEAALLDIKPSRRTLREFLPAGVNPLFLDLLDTILVWSPGARLTAAQALSHPAFVDWADPSDEPSGPPGFEWDAQPEMEAQIRQWAAESS